MQKIEHYTDSQLTREKAHTQLKKEKIVVAYYTNQQNANSVVHSHPYHELILPIAGSEVVYSIEGGLYTVHLGEMIYFPPESFHSAHFHVTEHVSERLVVQIDNGLWQEAKLKFQKMDQGLDEQFLILAEDPVFDWNLKGLLERMAQSRELEEDDRNVVFLGQVIELQAYMLHITKEKTFLSHGTTNKLVSRAVSYLQEHYQEADLNVKKLADELFTSREHLSRVFKEYTMESIHKYLTNLRMQKCRHLLSQGETVEEACRTSGFSDYTSFLKNFRSLYGITPSEYRTRIERGRAKEN